MLREIGYDFRVIMQKAVSSSVKDVVFQSGYDSRCVFVGNCQLCVFIMDMDKYKAMAQLCPIY